MDINFSVKINSTITEIDEKLLHCKCSIKIDKNRLRGIESTFKDSFKFISGYRIDLCSRGLPYMACPISSIIQLMHLK